MSCNNCLTYECVSLPLQMCGSAAVLPVFADETGVWHIELKGVITHYMTFNAVAGELIELPAAIFNENLNHTAILTRPSGSILCLHIETFIAHGTPYTPPTPPDPTDVILLTVNTFPITINGYAITI